MILGSPSTSQNIWLRRSYVLVWSLAYFICALVSSDFFSLQPWTKATYSTLTMILSGALVNQLFDFFQRTSDEIITIQEDREKLYQSLSHREKLASIGELAAGVGHEINNPLTIIMGNILRLEKMLKAEGSVTPKIEKAINHMSIASDRISNIVEGLGTYARYDTNQTEVFSTAKALNQTVKLIAEILHKDGVTLNIDATEEELLVDGSFGKLQQVIMNILINARDATEGQAMREINVSLKKISSDKLELSISDNGVGMSEEVKKKIFDPFFTTKELGKGTGMGLGLVAKIIDEMSGSIDLKSQEGKGSTFSIELPIAKAI